MEPIKNEVFRLINSLTKNEKGYIKKYSKIFVNAENSKLKIYYNIIEKMKIYDKNKLKKELDKHGGYALYRNIKNILYHQLLEDLMMLNITQSNSKNYFIEHLKMNYLFEKGMYDLTLEYYKILDKVRDENSSILSNYMYTTFLYYHKFLLGNITEIEPELVNNMDIAFDEIAMYRHILKGVANLQFAKLKSQKLPIEDKVAIFKEFHDNYILPIPKDYNSTTIKLISSYYTLLLNYCNEVKDIESYYYYSKRFYDIFSTKEIRIKNNHSFVNSVLDYANSLVKKNDIELYKVLDDFEDYVYNSKHINFESYIKTIFFQISINSYINIGDTVTLSKFVTKHLDEIKSMNFNHSTKTIIGTNLLFLNSFFILKKYKEINPFINILLSKNSKEIAPEYYFATKLIDLMMHFEMNNFENIPYYLKNLKTELLSFKSFSNEEIIFFKLLNKVCKEANFKTSNTIKLLFKILSNENLPSYIEMSKMKNWVNNIINKN